MNKPQKLSKMLWSNAVKKPSEGRLIGVTTFENGVLTKLSEFKLTCRQIAQEIGGSLFIGLYNSTEEYYRNDRRTNDKRKGVDTLRFAALSSATLRGIIMFHCLT